MESKDNVISEGEQVVLWSNKGFYMIKKASASTSLRMGKKKNGATLAGLVGEPYGSMFHLVGSEMVRMSSVATDTELTEISAPEDGVIGDNRHIKLKEEQTMSAEAIQAMREEGKPVEEIIGQLVESHAAYDSKTAFSQAKYIVKKKQKYEYVLTAYKATAARVADALFDRSPRKLCFLRPDALAYMLTAANVRAGASYAIVDGTNGLLTGAVLERCGGHGKVVNYGRCASPQLHSLSIMHWAQGGDSPILAPLVTTQLEALVNPELAAELAPLPLAEGTAHGLLMVPQDDPLPVLQAIYPILGLGEPFAIFFSYAEPLVACFQWLVETDSAIALRLSHTFLRPQQVLPDRTHPEVSFHNTSGFVLAGHKSMPLADDPSAPTAEEIAAAKARKASMRRTARKRQRSGVRAAAAAAAASPAAPSDDDGAAPAKRAKPLSAE
ncbi:tRNA (adenine-N(1)-)-methyltransferase non-catalytic subunit TRM6 [Thecamonas trahens ATCC 50062]|uniref:tRNA (adenine(58)-N(1))-methyltransferase non-catalytic subunit TRM6 n=1 Tax=Thecamonas trahens ATCC 50062 TaxID=461836 RepID=A0A0L0DVG8_THETB|nr:tRNA (adenine-N(1)-)-methyltransferase non-catalytic subunit TRM6 [Thecamonas trahens ATCC 50062]KNC56309.1 tRNA (adenine-N(1)-)-methyltransferase non-catalytic subunit TRM6 [Thecamonas trahens ATCC 50062]|eukprot:XP_013760828.1 tRNA (adenine-N(1)-)-methyltransferase non-catalytic subunit TRM6 [Thecamonas trahens ATCC 50062]